jgi:NADPH:quinone reductase-like Zn-dependent oxidoreductase
MKKISIPSAGGYEKLVMVEAPDPVPGPGEVLIDVKGIGVNFADVAIRLGVYASAKLYVGWPITPGFEVSGLVERVGEGVTKFKPGDEVVAVTRFNGYATKLAINERFVMNLPKGFDLLEAAGFPTVFLTAYYALKQIFVLRKRGTVLIHSAAGGVGSSLVQLAKAYGQVAIGIVGSSHKVDFVKKLGADVVIDKSADPHYWETLKRLGHHGKIDLIFDAHGSDTVEEGYKALKPTGKIVVYGRHSLFSKEGGRLNYPKVIWKLLTAKRFSSLKLINENKGIMGFNLSFLFDQGELLEESLDALMGLANEGLIHPTETTFIPFDKAADAHRLIESGKSRGKIVLTT